jgi:YVTN family beta-propeller protein
MYHIMPPPSRIYVANGSHTVSVIEGITNKIIKNIPVGMYPSAIAVDGIRDRLYVANGGSDTVSVIDTQNNTRIGKDIPVGKNPSAIAVDEGTNTTYVANSGDDTVSIIDSEANKVVAKVMFNIEASNSGNIQCDNTNGSAPLRQQFYVYSGSGCTARPNPGFDFVSWQENLGRNSTQLINATTEPSTLDTILDFFHPMPPEYT